MRHCLDEIGKFQKQTLDYPTRTYNAKTLRSDIERSDTYYLQQLLGIDLNTTQKANYAYAKTFLVDQIEKIPVAPMHFDFAIPQPRSASTRYPNPRRPVVIEA